VVHQATCISVNDEAAHGIPSPTRHLRAGDLANLDASAELDGYFSDTGVSVAVGDVSEAAFRLLEATRQTQLVAMDSARPGHQLRDIGRAVQSSARARGFRVIRNLCGHGIGHGLHEWPSVPQRLTSSKRAAWSRMSKAAPETVETASSSEPKAACG